MQCRFPIRSRKAAAEEVPGPVTSRDDLYLAPAHEAVLSLTSPDNPKKTDCGTDVPDPARSTNFITNGNRPLNLPLTITAVPGHTSEHAVEAQLASSSAGSNAEHEAAGSSCGAAPVASVLLQGAQAMLLRQQQQEEAAHAAVYAANTALLGAQACAQHCQLAFEGYLHLPEVVHQGWYWTERGGDQRGPYSVAELFHMAHGSKTVSVNQEIHNYFEEVSIRIRDKLNEHRGLMAAWEQIQNATTAVDDAQSAVLHAHEEVQAATGQTAAAAAAVAAVVATEAKWRHSSASQDSQGFTPSELAEEIADGRLQPGQDVIPLSQAGTPRSAGDVVQGWKAALDYAHQQAKLAGSAMQSEAEAHQANVPPADPASAFTQQCWAYWDGQQQQGPFALQDYHSWVSSGHFVDSMTVYHTSDTQTPYTLAALFSQAAPHSQPPLPPDPTPAAATPLLGLHAGMQTVPLPSSSSQHPQQQQQQPCCQRRQDLAPKAKAIAEQLRQQLLESGKQAVYQLLKKSVHEALPGLVGQAQAARAAAAAQEAAEAERRRVEAEQEAARAAAEAEAKACADALEKKRLEAEALARFEREEEEARVAAEAAAAAKRRRREEAREEARRKRAEEERIRQEAAARAAAEEAAKAEAQAAAQQAWRDENLRRKAEAAARQLAAEQEAAHQAAVKAAAERAAAEERAVKEAAARKAAAEKAAAEKAAAEAAAREAAERQAQEERAAAEQVRLLAAKMAAERLAAEQLAEEEARAQPEREAQRKAELKSRRVAVAQAMQEKKAAKAAAKKEQQEKAKVARAASMAVKAAARAAEAEAAAAGACVHLSSDDDFLGPLRGRSQQPCQATEQSRHSSHDAAGPSRSLTGAAQHAQHGQAGSAPAGRKQPTSKNGYYSHHTLAQHSHRISHDSQAVLAESGAQDSEADFESPVESERKHTPHLFHDQYLKDEDSWRGAHAQYMHSRGARQLPSELPASGSESRQPDSEEADREADRGADEEFDWGAWMSPEGKGIAERLQRPRRPPKRPYPLPDPPKPKPKKPHQSLRGSSSQHRNARLQHRPPDRLLMQGSGSTAYGHFSQEDWSHALGPVQQPHRHRPGSAPPNRTAAASHGAAKGRSKGRRALEEVGCIRAAAYQGEAFMQARMDVLHQQGILPGNQAPADAHPDHQAMPHTVRVVGGKQRGHRSAVRDLSRDEAVTDASKWGLLKGRTQDLRFGRSRVHAWGLFAKQDIEPEEFIVEYVGQTIRTSLLDVREKAYERSGLGSSYLFRIDESWAVDATRQGGLARFINHSCDPNCYTKIITVDGHKHIVIYSKHHIHGGEELSYDYKFEYELTEEPIKCTCGAVNCRGRLN